MTTSSPTPPIPITILTGFLGSGKTTLLLSLIPQLRALNPSYKLALLKNEFGDLAIDSQLASSSAITGVKELLNGCICCNLVGSLGNALEELEGASGQRLDRIVIETSGSAFPATLAMEVNRLSASTGGKYVLDGVITVIDVENWKGYEDTSYTARLQARYTDLVVFNKWEGVGERRWEECLDRLGDLEVQVATVKSEKGRVEMGLCFGIDGALARGLSEDEGGEHAHEHEDGHEHKQSHQSEVEVLSITLKTTLPDATINTTSLTKLLETAPKDEVYRIKSVFAASEPIPAPDSESEKAVSGRYILNWAFGRWTCTLLKGEEHVSSKGERVVLRMTMILARFESKKWKKKIETLGFVGLEGGMEGELRVEKIG